MVRPERFDDIKKPLGVLACLESLDISKARNFSSSCSCVSEHHRTRGIDGQCTTLHLCKGAERDIFKT